jgi:hypothetical protein
MMHPFSFYAPDQRDRDVFGELYDPPAEFDHLEWHRVATLKGEGDGRDVEIHELRAPARFFRIVAAQSVDSVGRVSPGFTMSTGSGDDMARLAVRIAEAIAQGMLGLDLEGQR